MYLFGGLRKMSFYIWEKTTNLGKMLITQTETYGY